MGVHDGHRKRLIGRFLEEGLENFAPHQVLELLLFFSIPRQDTNALAHALLARYGSLQGVLDAPYASLLENSGVGENTAALLKLVPELTRAYLSDQGKGTFVNSLEAAVGLLRPRFAGRKEELVYALFTDGKGKCLAVELVHRGSVNAAEVNVRSIVSRAMVYNASGMVLAHNHPSGMAMPSQEDMETTSHLCRALEPLNIHLMDHLVFVRDDYVSMRQSGWL